MVAALDQLAGELRFTGPADLLQAALERGVIVAAVELVLALERRDGGDRVRHLGVRHQIAAAELDAVDAQVLRHDVEQPFAEEIGLEAARPAIGADRRLVGELQRDVDVDVLDPVGPGHELRDVACPHRAVGAHIGADVHIGVTAQSQDGAVARAGDLHVAFRLARMVHAHQVLAAILGPFHRPPGLPRRERNQKVLRIEFAARAEAAADVVLHDLDLVFGKAELLRQSAAVEEQHLGAARDGKPPTRRVPFGKQAARLHRQRHVPLRAEAFAPRIGRGLERRRGVAAHRVELDRLVGAVRLEKQRCVLC